MSPTIFHENGFRFFSFSREEPRMRAHVHCGHGEAKYWMEPEIELAKNYGLTAKDLQTVQRLVEAHADAIRNAWRKHFGS